MGDNSMSPQAGPTNTQNSLVCMSFSSFLIIYRLVLDLILYYVSIFGKKIIIYVQNILIFSAAFNMIFYVAFSMMFILQANYQFTRDELRVLRECNSESFFQRSLPVGTGFGVAAYFAVKNGYLKGSARFGPAPKVVVGVIIGYFMGKFSYQRKCAEKIMQLPNSRLAEVLRAKKKGTFYETFTPDQGFGASLGMAPFANQPSGKDQYSDEFYRGVRFELFFLNEYYNNFVSIMFAVETIDCLGFRYLSANYS